MTDSLVLEVLKAIRKELVPGFDFRPADDVSIWVPSKSRLESSSNLGSTFDSYGLESTTALGDLDQSGMLAKVRRAQAIAATMKRPPAQQPIPGLAGNAPSAFEERLLLEVPNSASNATKLAFDLISQTVAPSSITDKAGALVQMRRIDNVFIRLNAAALAATRLGRPIEEALAFYRVEGALGVPPSSTSINRLIPSDVPDEPSSMPRYVKVAPKKFKWPHLIWLGRIPFMFNGETFKGTTAPDLKKEPAVVDFALQLCGLDAMAEVYWNRGSRTMAEAFGDWSNRNWVGAGISDQPADARQRWTDLVQNLEIIDVSVDVIAVAPRDPVAFVGGLLAEGMAHMLAAQPDIPVSLPDLAMKYFVYHAGPIPAMGLFTRSLLEIFVNKPPGFGPILAEINADSVLTEKLTALSKVGGINDSPTVLALMDLIRKQTSDWLTANDPVRINLLASFLETAGSSAWPTWTTHRGNLSRYMVLLDYYRRLFA